MAQKNLYFDNPEKFVNTEIYSQSASCFSMICLYCNQQLRQHQYTLSNFSTKVDSSIKQDYNEKMDNNLITILQNAGLSDKASRVYLAALELGEATVQQLAKTAGLKRTTIYYTLEELMRLGAVAETKRNKKTYYIAEAPAGLLKAARKRVADFEENLDELQEKKNSIYKVPRVYFLYGPQGFKKIWDMIFESGEKEYRIITQGENFLDFVKEKYILDEIIQKKKKLKIFSKQLISDSAYAKTIIAKDARENRESKLLPPVYKLPFTELITDRFVALISPRFENMLLVIENTSFAKTRKSLFEVIWNSVG